MIDDPDREGVDMDVHLIAALSERAVAMNEEWRFQATLLILTEMLSSEAQETNDDQDFLKIREILGSILTLMLYLDKLPTEEEIESEVLGFRKLLNRVNEDPEEEEPSS